MTIVVSLLSAVAPSSFLRHSQSTQRDRDARIQRQALLLIALIAQINAQYTGTLYPQPEVDLGEGFDPLFIDRSGQPDLVWGQTDSGLMRQRLGFDGSPLLTQHQSVASSPFHSKKAVVYPNGQIGMALEAVVDSIRHLDFCLWNSDWSLSKCQRIHTGTREELPHRPDVAYGDETTVVAAMHMAPIDRNDASSDIYYSELTFLDRMFLQDGLPLQLRTDGNHTLIRNPSIAWNSQTQKFICVFSLNEGNPTQTRTAFWRPTKQSISPSDKAWENTQFLFPSLTGRPRTYTPPNTQLFDLGMLGYGVSFHDPYQSVGLETGPGHRALFFSKQGDSRGLSEINVVSLLATRAGNPDSEVLNGPFIAFNDSHFFGAWPVTQQLRPIPYLLRGQFFTFTENRVESVSEYITIFESATDAWSNPNLFVIPGQQGLIIAAEKAGRIWVKALHFQESINVPTTTTQAASRSSSSTTPTSTATQPSPSTAQASKESSALSPGDTSILTSESTLSSKPPPTSSSTPEEANAQNSTKADHPQSFTLTHDDSSTSRTFTPLTSEDASPFPSWTIGAIVGGILLFLGSGLACLWTHRRKNETSSQSHQDTSLGSCPVDPGFDSSPGRSSLYGPAPEDPRQSNQYTAGPPLAQNGYTAPGAHQTYAKAPPPNVDTVFVGDIPGEQSRQSNHHYDTVHNSGVYVTTDQPLV